MAVTLLFPDAGVWNRHREAKTELGIDYKKVISGSCCCSLAFHIITSPGKHRLANQTLNSSISRLASPS